MALRIPETEIRIWSTVHYYLYWPANVKVAQSMITVSLGTRLSILRKQHKLTQTDLSRKLGISNVHVSMVEADKSEISIPLLRKWLAVFGKKLDIRIVD